MAAPRHYPPRTTTYEAMILGLVNCISSDLYRKYSLGSSQKEIKSNLALTSAKETK